MLTIEIIYLITSTASLVISVPQLRQLVITKRSDELNVATWTMWLIHQFVFLGYALTLRQTTMLITNSIWTLFYAAMLGLIVYYRRNPGPLPEEVIDK